MKIVSLEPTPNPNSMKLNMDESLPEGVQLSFTTEAQVGAPPYIRHLLTIPGVRSVYQTADFITLGRSPTADWPSILAEARRVFEQEAEGAGAAQTASAGAEYTGVKVLLQMLRSVPMQVKVMSDLEEVRVGLSDRFRKAAAEVAAATPDMLAERTWRELGIRYGDMQEIAEDAAAQVESAYDDARLARLVELARSQAPGEVAPPDLLSPDAAAARLGDSDWRKRYAALEEMALSEAAVPVLDTAMADKHPSVRRLAVVCLGAIKEADVVDHLIRGLQDSSAAVRRAAGDCLSDRGAAEAIGAMAATLHDSSKLVRWRAARFLYEVGDESALGALRAAQEDPEFEVSLQVKLAIERIEGGHEAAGPVWQQMTRGLREKEK